MNKLRLKLGDKVKIITGSDKNCVGTIKCFFRKNNTLIVDQLNLRFKHEKPVNQENSGQIKKIEAPIHQSNVMLCDSDDIASRFGMKIVDKKKVRISKKTNKIV